MINKLKYLEDACNCKRQYLITTGATLQQSLDKYGISKSLYYRYRKKGVLTLSSPEALTIELPCPNSDPAVHRNNIIQAIISCLFSVSDNFMIDKHKFANSIGLRTASFIPKVSYNTKYGKHTKAGKQNAQKQIFIFVLKYNNELSIIIGRMANRMLSFCQICNNNNIKDIEIAVTNITEYYSRFTDNVLYWINSDTLLQLVFNNSGIKSDIYPSVLTFNIKSTLHVDDKINKIIDALTNYVNNGFKYPSLKGKTIIGKYYPNMDNNDASMGGSSPAPKDIAYHTTIAKANRVPSKQQRNDIISDIKKRKIFDK